MKKKLIIIAVLLAMLTTTIVIAKVGPSKLYKEHGIFGLIFKGSSAEKALVPTGMWIPAEGDMWYDTTDNIYKSYTGSVWNAFGVRSISKTMTYSQFTDGGGTSGTVTFAGQIPLGAVVTRTLISDITGFTGDTSAVITVGDGTDVDRYNTGTPSVFTTIAAVDAGVVSGTVYHAAAKAPVITVTSGSDWGLVTAGSVTVTIFYYYSG